jgi:hypothetical protein
MLREMPSMRFWSAGALVGLLDGAFAIALYAGSHGSGIGPLTRARTTPPASSLFFVMLAWHAVGVGLPIALMLRR